MIIHCSYDKLIDINDLKPHPKNRNKHPADQIKRLTQILQYQGIRSPIKVSNRSGFITAGHGRLEAFRHLKIKEIPVNFQDYDSDEQEYADIQSDNAIALWAELDLSGINTDMLDLGPDFDIDLLGIKDFVLEPAEKFEPQSDEDEVPEVKESFVKLGDIWTLGKHRLMCGDSTSIDAAQYLIGDATINLLFTDPPYGINVVNVGATSKMGFVGAKSAPSPLARARAYKPIIGDDKEFDPNHLFAIECDTRILWGANYYASRLPDQPQWLVWDKKIQDGGLDHNNFSDCELAWTDAKGKAVKVYRHVWAGMLRHGSRKEEMKERVHPTQKPVGLCEQIILEFSKDGESIIDLYGGSGSTLIACEKTNRKCFMMELDPHYCGVIIERWQKYTGQKAERIHGETEN